MNNLTIESILSNFQDSFTLKLQNIDPSVQLKIDKWDRSTGGGGKTHAMEGGDIIEKAGVNFSHVFGDSLPASASAHRPHLAGLSWEALGVSTIVHPKNPFMPTCHANIRLFKTGNTWWTGGGFDLTPYYGFQDDCILWHNHAKKSCDPFGDDLYPKFKKWADEYFYLPHRNEARGIGGIFFDDFTLEDYQQNIAFLNNVATHFMDSYMQIFEKRKEHKYDENHRNWQLYRRGRYVEFNLLYDRGTLFGLQSKGRVESILISMPNIVHFNYDFKPTASSEEEKLIKEYLPSKDWLNLNH